MCVEGGGYVYINGGGTGESQFCGGGGGNTVSGRRR